MPTTDPDSAPKIAAAQQTGIRAMEARKSALARP